MENNILIVDDDKNTRQLLTATLQQEGFGVVSAENGIEALGHFIHSLVTAPFALIILDVVMPRPDGLTVLEIIRKEEALRGIQYGEGIPIIMLTGHKDTCMDSFNKGCDDYMIKPVKTAELISKIRSKIK
jgi:DNA-binding response OmpR family regulator